MPVMVTRWGDPLVLSVILRVALLAPEAVGENFTLAVQLAPEASTSPLLQVPIPPNGKSPAFAPPIDSIPMVTFPVPVLRYVNSCVAVGVPTTEDPKLKLVGVSEAESVVPVPDKDTACGDPEALSVIVALPDLTPAIVGVNDMTILQDKLAPRLDGQVLVWAKSPDMAIEDMLSEAVPMLVRTTVCVALVVPTA